MEASGNEKDPVPRSRTLGAGGQSLEQDDASQLNIHPNPEESNDWSIAQFDENETELSDRASIEEEPDSTYEDLDLKTKEGFETTEKQFLLFRNHAIKLFRSFLNQLLTQISPSLDVYAATLEELRRAHTKFEIEKVMGKFEDTIHALILSSLDKQHHENNTLDPKDEFMTTIEDLKKNNLEHYKILLKQHYEKITLISKDVTFYAKILRVFFETEYDKCPALQKVAKLRSTQFHPMKDRSPLTLEIVKKTIDEAELEVYNLTRRYFSAEERSQLLLSAREETLKLNTRSSYCNVLTCVEQRQEYPSIHGNTINQVFVSPIMMFNNQSLTDLSEVFSNDKAIGACTSLRAIFLSGSCGIGKSTLAHRLVQDWLNGPSPPLDQFEMVLLVDMHRGQYLDIVSYLKDAMPSTMEHFDSENIIQCFSELQVLLVIDGFDSRYPWRIELLRDICDKFKRSTAVIVASIDSLSKAQSFFRSVGDDRRPVVKVFGFDSKRCEDFAQKFFAVLEDQRIVISEKFGLAMKHRQNLLPSQLVSPLEASLTMLVLLANPETNVKWLESTPKLCYSLLPVSRRPHPEEERKNVALLRLGEVCLLKLKSDGRLELSSKEETELGLKEDELLSFCLVKCTKDNSERVFSFCSVSLMQYFAAAFLANDLQTNYRSLLSYFENDLLLFRELLPFLVRDQYLPRRCTEEVFNGDFDTNKITRSDDIYIYWYSIVSQMDHSSKDVFPKSIVQILQDSDWCLDNKSLVPAALLLKLCGASITQKITINLTGTESSSNELMMHHLRDCLQENYCSESAISLSLRLSNVETSCMWLEGLEQPFLHLTDFTGHVNADSVLMLRQCQQLSSVTLRLSSVESFNNFTECYEVWQNLETVKLYVCFLEEMSDDEVKRLVKKDVDTEPSSFEIIFDGLESQQLNKFIKLLLDILPSDQDLFRIVLCKTTLNFADARKLLSQKYFENGCLDVTSTCSLNAEEKRRLKKETFQDEDGLHQWPFFQFSWNGRHW